MNDFYYFILGIIVTITIFFILVIGLNLYFDIKHAKDCVAKYDYKIEQQQCMDNF